MSMRLESCPSCGGKVLFYLGPPPKGQADQGDRFENECRRCGKKVRLSPSITGVTSPVSEPGDTSASSGGGPGLGGSAANDDRSNTLNPNNPANKAARDNRANQLNPNSRAYRSSRGR